MLAKVITGCTKAALGRRTTDRETPRIEETPVSREKRKYDVDIGTVTGNDAMSIAMRAVYSGECTAYKAARRYGVQERTLHRRVQSQETQGIVKRGRKYQMLPAEEKKFCAFLEWSASINKSRTESLFLNEIKDHFDHLEIRSDFEENKPGHGWYCQFLKRSEEEVRRHTMPSLKKKILHHLEATYERARNNCLEKNVNYNRHNLYLCTTSTFNITTTRYVSMMVLLNAAGTVYYLVCYPKDYECEEMACTIQKYGDTLFLTSEDGTMKRDEFAEAARELFPVCSNRAALFCVWPKDMYSYTLYNICTRKNLIIIALDVWLDTLVACEKQLLSLLHTRVNGIGESMEESEINGPRVAGVKVEMICECMKTLATRNMCADTCKIYGVFPTGSYWMYTNIKDMEVPDDFKEIFQISSPTGSTRVRREQRVTSPANSNNGRSESENANEQRTERREPETWLSMLERQEISPLLRRACRGKVPKPRKPRRNKTQMAADREWERKEKEARFSYWTRIDPLKTTIRRMIAQEKARRRRCPRPTRDPSSFHYIPGQ